MEMTKKDYLGYRYQHIKNGWSFGNFLLVYGSAISRQILLNVFGNETWYFSLKEVFNFPFDAALISRLTIKLPEIASPFLSVPVNLKCSLNKIQIEKKVVSRSWDNLDNISKTASITCIITQQRKGSGTSGKHYW